jgi:hypothetical protein
MLIHRAGEIRLLDELEHVLGLHHDQLARRAREKSVRAGRRRVEAVALERGAQARLVLLALRPFLLEVDAQAELRPQREIVAFPEPAPGRKIVRADAGERFARIAGRAAVRAVGVLLEEERAVRKHSRVVQRFAQIRGDRSQILTDDHAAVAAALLRQQPEQVLERIVDVAALVGLTPGRDPVQARERHHVVEA